MREPEKRTPREEEAYVRAFLEKGRRLQAEQNRNPNPRGIITTPQSTNWLKQGQLAREHIAAEKARQQEWLENLKQEQANKAQAAADEALIQEEIKAFEAKLRIKRGVK